MISTSEKASFLRKVFGPLELSRDKINVAVKCPACSKTSGKKKLVIRLDDDRYHCWVCGIKGRNLLSLIKKYASFLFLISLGIKVRDLVISFVVTVLNF